jgi:hypothetical protein
MRFGVMAGLGLCLAGVLAVPGMAQQPTQAQASAIRSACRADYQAHCASVPTGGTAALSCLQQNAASLSAPCQRALAAVGGAPAEPAPGPHAAQPQAGSPPPPGSPREQARFVRQFCAADYRRLCAGVRPGGGAGIACLRENAQALSPGCIKALQSAKTLD